MNHLKKIKLLIATAMVAISSNAQITNENIVACGLAIKSEADAINNLSQEHYCAFRTIMLNDSLSEEEKNAAIASNQSISHLITVRQYAQNQLISNNCNLIVNDNEKKELLIDWLVVNVAGGIINVGEGKCDQYNREVRAVVEDWSWCLLETGLITPWSLGCSRRALRDLRNLDLEYPECANGKNGGIIFKPWIGDETTLTCPNGNTPGQ